MTGGARLTMQRAGFRGLYVGVLLGGARGVDLTTDV